MSMSNDQIESNSKNNDQSSNEDEVKQINEFDQLLQRNYKRLKLLASPTNVRNLHGEPFDAA